MKLSRRNLLLGGASLAGSSAFAAPPLARLASIMLQSALAQTPPSEMNYLVFCLETAPNRWMFDHWLKKTGEQITENPMVVTEFTGANHENAAYNTFSYKGLEIPTLWRSPVKSAAGGYRTMESLLDHMIVLRGYGSGVDGHSTNFVKQLAPVSGAGGLLGRSADQSSQLFKAVIYPSAIYSTTSFGSTTGVGPMSIGYSTMGNLFESLLDPFTKRPYTASVTSVRERYAGLIANAGAALKQAVVARAPGSSAVFVDQEAAIKGMTQGFEDLTAAWDSLFGKYSSIINGTFKDQAADGYFPKALVTPGLDAQGKQIKTCSLTIGGSAFYPTPGQDMRQWLNSAELIIMAQSFALAEFVMTRKMGSTLQFGLLAPENLQLQTGERTRLIFDQHFTGQRSALFLNSSFYRAYGAALVELVDRLKAAKIFDKTAIHLVSDFGRTPRNDGGGSDHGFDAMITSIITGGRTQGPLMLGNIMKEVPGETYTGTFGIKAPFKFDKTVQPLGMAHMGATVAEILRLRRNPLDKNDTRNPFATTAPSLVQVVNNEVVKHPDAEEAKVVS